MKRARGAEKKRPGWPFAAGGVEEEQNEALNEKLLFGLGEREN